MTEDGADAGADRARAYAQALNAQFAARLTVRETQIIPIIKQDTNGATYNIHSSGAYSYSHSNIA
jgi:hypothetical protein